MVKFDKSEIQSMLDMGKEIDSNNTALNSLLSRLQGFANENRLQGATWSGAKLAVSDAFVPLVKGQIIYNEQVQDGNRKVQTALNACPYDRIDEESLNREKSQQQTLHRQAEDSLRDIQSWKRQLPTLGAEFDVMLSAVSAYASVISGSIASIDNQLKALHTFLSAVRGAYDAANQTKASLDTGYKRMGKNSAGIYSNGQFNLTTTEAWASNLTKDYQVEQTQELLSQLEGSGEDFDKYQKTVKAELDYMDAHGWTEQGKEDYVKYLNAEYTHYKDNTKSIAAIIGNKEDYFAPNGAYNLVLMGINAFIEHPDNFAVSKINFEVEEGSGITKQQIEASTLFNHSQWNLTTPEGDTVNPLFLNYIGKDVPGLKYIEQTYYIAYPGIAHDGVDYNLYDKPNDIGSYDQAATTAFKNQGSTIQAQYLFNDLPDEVIKRDLLEGAKEVAVSTLIIAAVQLIPYADVVVDTALVGEAGYDLVAKGKLSEDDWLNLATLGLAKGLGAIKVVRELDGVTKIDYYGKVTAEARNVRLNELYQSVSEIDAEQQSRLTAKQTQNLVKLSDGNPESKTTLLGSWQQNRKSYEQLAYKKGYNYYDMGDAYNELNGKIPSAGQQVNDAWLDEKIKAGNDFVLSTSEKDAGDSLQTEIKMLKKNGYVIPDKPSSDGLYHIVKGGK
ncbi:MAG: hypothetical protein LBI13_08795 [Streptococcaceae bacterium]|jgi:hypothetical protein|nr:hypothetical protein [Streptococcaceae bacterium]